MAGYLSYHKIKSSDNEHTFVMTTWEPREKPRGIVQLVHGMREHIGRYNDFANFLNDQGFLVCGHDHIGHGKSALVWGSFGYFGKKNGAKTLVDDTVGVTRYLSKKYEELPIILLGHSMGSFIARLAAVQVADIIEGLIVTGTGSDALLSPLARALTQGLSSFSGGTKNNYWADKAFNTFVERGLFKGEKKDAWISRDAKVVAKFERDPLTNFSFTNQGYSDLLDLQMACNSDEWYARLDKTLPILLLSGTRDPIGGFGLDVPKIAKKLHNAGIRDVHYRLYPGARHELLNEINKKDIYKYILAWIDLHIGG